LTCLEGLIVDTYAGRPAYAPVNPGNRSFGEL